MGPHPHAPGEPRIPLVINAASSAVGSYAIKLAKLNTRISPIIATAGASSEHVRPLGADAVVDYKSPTVSDDTRAAAGGKPINHIFDAANSLTSVKYLAAVIQPNTGRYTSTLPVSANPFYDPEGAMQKVLDGVGGVWYEQIWCADVHDGKKAGGTIFGALMSKVFEQMLVDGKLIGQPYEVVPGGLNGVKGALEKLRDRKRGGNAKFVTRIADTVSLKGHNS